MWFIISLELRYVPTSYYLLPRYLLVLSSTTSSMR